MADSNYTTTDTPEHEMYLGDRSVKVVPGHHKSFLSSLITGAMTNSAYGFMLVDLSNASARWPHTETGHIQLETVSVHIQPTDNSTGFICVGYISAVAAASATVNVLHEYEILGGYRNEVYFLAPKGYYQCRDTNSFLAAHTAVAQFGTGVNSPGPDGNNYNAGNGDLVLYTSITSATNVYVNITVQYHTLRIT
jgi:hypothetical protein